MVLDGQIHIREGQADAAGFSKRLKDAGVDGGVVVSLPPAGFLVDGQGREAAQRLDNLIEVAKTGENLYPFFWIDPLDDDALEQVGQAVEKGVAGFKVVCDRYLPSDELVLETVREIAASNRPILFHSGILWDGKASSSFSRPAEFEALLDVEGLRFSLAHIAWPWCDECLAVYGKFLNASLHRPNLKVEMFLDTTPGTPAIYREEVLTKLFTVGYDVVNNVIFGSESNAGDYNVKHVRDWVARDRKIMEKLQVGEETMNKVFGGNLLRFIAPGSATPNRKAPNSGA